MSRLATRFEALRSSGRKALLPYIVAGDPEPGLTVSLMHDLVAAGADIIELGVPFTDPEAEGPVIQLAHERALKHRVTLTDTLAMVTRFREQDQDTPVLLMGYINPVEAMGYERFAAAAAEAGVDAVLMVNVPPEEGELLDQSMLAHNLDCVYLLAPTTTDERAQYILSKGRGFVYYVSLKGTTGAAMTNMDEVEQRLEKMRRYSDIPIVVGFGIKDGPSAARAASFSDGAVVGTAVVQLFETYAGQPDQLSASIRKLVGELRTAMDG